MTLTQTIAEPIFVSSPEENEYYLRRAVHDRMWELDLHLSSEARRHGSAVARDLGDLLVTDWDCPTALDGRRGRAAGMREAESLLLCLVTAGEQVVQTPTQSIVLRPGVMLVMSTRAACTIAVPENMTKRTLRVPMTALAPYDTGRGIPDFLSIDIANCPLARLTQDFLHGIDGQLERMTAADVEDARSALLALLAGLIRAAHMSDVSETDFLPMLRRSLENWIVDHLGEGAIRVDSLAAAHSVAPRTVHRAFASTGDTMGSVVRAHRLAAVRNDLVRSQLSIAAIASRWGFCDASHLGREFRREFLMSPGDYRAAHRVA